MNKNISIKKSIRFGWDEFWSKPWFWIISYLIVFGATFSTSGMENSLKNWEMDGTNNYQYRGTSEISRTDTIDLNTLDSTDITIDSDEKLDLDDLNLNLQEQGLVNQINKEKEGVTDTASYLPMIIGLIVATPVVIAVGILSYIVKQILMMGYIHLNLDANRGKKTEYKTILSDVNVKKALRILGASVLYALIVFLGLILLIVPGIYFAVKYFWHYYFIVDKDVTIKEAFKMSAEVSKGIKLRTIGLFIALGFLNLLGLLVMFVGIIPTSIMSGLAVTNMYNEISKDTKTK